MPSMHLWIVDGRAALAAAAARPPGACSIDLPALATALSADERARLHGFQRPARTAEFVLGRLLLRHALLQLLDCPPGAIDVIERTGAAPLVTVDGRPADGITLPGLSLSHSRGWIACAVGETCPVGVDIEAAAVRRDTQSLALSLFSSREQEWLAQQPRQDEAFHRLWCAKEALYKYRHNAGLRNMAGLPGLPVVVPEAAVYAGIDVPDAHLQHHTEDDYYLSLCGPPQTKAQPCRLHRIGADALLNSSSA